MVVFKEIHTIRILETDRYHFAAIGLDPVAYDYPSPGIQTSAGIIERRFYALDLKPSIGRFGIRIYLMQNRRKDYGQDSRR